MADYVSTNSKGECVFCGIVKGSIQTPGIFWQDKNFMAFLSTWPNTEGFTVVIPKKHYLSDCLALPDTVLQEFIIAAKKVSNILLKHFDDVGRIGLIMEGTGVDHAHIKLIPLHNTQNLKEGRFMQFSNKNKQFFNEYPGFLISCDGPKADIKQLKKLARELSNIDKKS